MTERVARLRKESLEAKPSISHERAERVTESYARTKDVASATLLRALVFRHLMENRSIYIGKDELIVGEKGPLPKAAPTFPELCCHTLRDLEILDTREKIPFAVSRKRAGSTKS